MNDAQRPDRPGPAPGRPPAGQHAPPGPATGQHAPPGPATGHYAPPPGPAAGRYGPSPTGRFAPPPGRPIPPYPPAPRRRSSAWKVIGVVAAVLFGLPVVLTIVSLVAVAVRGDAPSGSSPPPVAASPFASDTVMDIRPGECFDSAPVPTDGSSTSVFGVEKIPCAEPHTQQAVDTTAYAGRPWSSVENEAGQKCDTAFTSKVSKKVLAGGRHVPAIMHSEEASSTYVVCVIATEQPTTGSVVQ